MLTATDLTPEGLSDYANKLATSEADSLTDDQVRIVQMAYYLSQLGLTIKQIRSLVNDD